MSTACLFVIAPSADYKVINRFLISFRDWEFGSGDRAHLVKTRNAYDLSNPNRHPGLEETVPPVPANVSNGWAGASIEDIEGFVIDAEKTEEMFNVILILDDKGAADETVIVATRHYDEDEEILLKDFDKARVPWSAAYVMWCNLDIGNMDWESYCEEDRSEGGAGWCRFVEGSANTGAEKGVAAERAAGIKKLAEEGMA